MSKFDNNVFSITAFALFSKQISNYSCKFLFAVYCLLSAACCFSQVPQTELLDYRKIFDKASGRYGSTRDYAQLTYDGLRNVGIHDKALGVLLKAVA